MKKTLLPLIAVCVSAVYTSLAQTNLNFETWSGNEPNGWITSNDLTMLSGGAQTVVKETASPGQGTTSVKMVTGNCPECPNFSIFGSFGGPATPFPDPMGGFIEQSAAISQKPISVDFKYKSNPGANDFAAFSVQLTKYDPLTQENETIGEGWFEAGTQVTNWTDMNMPIVYYSNLMPDTITIWATSSVGSIPDLSSLGVPPIFQLPAPVAGSQFYIDAIHINLPSCAGLSATVNGTSETSIGAMNGTASVTASGGTAPYTYQWSNGATASSISGLMPGLYSVVVVDGNGCAEIGNYNVLPFSCGAFSVSVTGTLASSFTAEDGTASATVTGASGPYSYLWNTGETTASISGLRLGSYIVQVTDISGTCVTWGYFPNQSIPAGMATQSVTDIAVAIQPNPSKGVFSIKSETEISKIEVINTLGKRVYQSVVENGMQEFDLANLPNGIYFLYMSNEKGSAIKKLIIEK